MQLISNIILNLILVYPILFIREYCVGKNRESHLKKLNLAAQYLFFINLAFINTAFYLEAFLVFYFALIIPLGIGVSIMMMKENDIKLFQSDETHDIGIKSKKLVVLVTGYVLLFILLSFANLQVDDQVMNVHFENLKRLSTSDKPLEELITVSQNPRTLVSELDRLLRINESDYAVLYSGNSKKIIKGTIRENEVLYTFELTYRRLDTHWELDGLYDWSERP